MCLLSICISSSVHILHVLGSISDVHLAPASQGLSICKVSIHLGLDKPLLEHVILAMDEIPLDIFYPMPQIRAYDWSSDP